MKTTLKCTVVVVTILSLSTLAVSDALAKKGGSSRSSSSGRARSSSAQRYQPSSQFKSESSNKSSNFKTNTYRSKSSYRSNKSSSNTSRFKTTQIRSPRVNKFQSKAKLSTRNLKSTFPKANVPNRNFRPMKPSGRSQISSIPAPIGRQLNTGQTRNPGSRPVGLMPSVASPISRVPPGYGGSSPIMIRPKGPTSPTIVTPLRPILRPASPIIATPFRPILRPTSPVAVTPTVGTGRFPVAPIVATPIRPIGPVTLPVADLPTVGTGRLPVAPIVATPGPTIVVPLIPVVTTQPGATVPPGARPGENGVVGVDPGVDTVATPAGPGPPILVAYPLLPIDFGDTPGGDTPPVDTDTPPVDTDTPPVDTDTPPVDTDTPPVYPPGDWCDTRPPGCHWWNDWCPGIRRCPPSQCVTYSCSVVTVADTKWYLGLTGMALPGQGFGVESVEVGSPAEASGLATGMVITSINGLQIVDAATMANAIATSINGLLEMEVMITAGTNAVPATVQMTRIVVSSF